MEISAYISINLLLFSSWYLFLYRKKDTLLFADRLTGAFVLGLSQIIATQMVLGVVFKKLYPLPLFILNLLISLTVLLPILMTGKGRGVFTDMRSEAARVFRILTEDKVLLTLFAFFAISLWWMITLGYLFPSYSWDALYYHLPMVGQIMQSGAIQENSTPSFIQQYINIFSKNVNLFFLWNIIFLKSDIVVDLSQLPFTLAGGLSVYSMAVKLKIKEKYALYSALLFFFTPVLMLQSTVNYVDGAVSMLFLMTLNFLIYDGLNSPALSEEELPFKEIKVPVLLSGLAAGILLGSKPTSPVFIIVLLAGVLLRIIMKNYNRKNPDHVAGGGGLKEDLRNYLVCFLVPALLMGGYWYMRNWIVHGNPVYYMDVSLFDMTLLTGLKSDWVEPSPPVLDNLNYLTRLFHVWLERVEYYMYDSRLSGFGPIWFILFLPSILFSLVHAVHKKKYTFLFVSVVLIGTFLIHPRNWTTRYVIFIVGAGALSFGLLLDYCAPREKGLKIIVLLLAGYTFFTANSPCIMPAKMKEFLLLPGNERTLSRMKPFNIDVKVRKEYGHWMWIDDNVSRGETLVYTFESFDLDTSRPFFTAPFWNSAYSNKVVYGKAGTYKEWLEKLNDVNATYILIKRNTTEDNWIKKEQQVFYSLRWMGTLEEKFRIVYEDEHYRIVRYKEAGP